METSDKSSKTQLEASNARLALAFHHLQSIIEKQFQSKGGSPLKHHDNDDLLNENNRLKEELQHLSQEYASLKQASIDAFTHLNYSINQLESLIVHDDKEMR